MVSLYYLISPYHVCLLCLTVTLPHHALSLPLSEGRLLLNFLIRCLEDADIPHEDTQSIQQVFPEPPRLDPSSLTSQSCPGVMGYFLTKLRATVAEADSVTGASLAGREDNPSTIREDDTGDERSRLAMKRSPGRSLDQKEMVKFWRLINDLLKGTRRLTRREVAKQFRSGVGVEWETGKSESQNMNIRIRPTRGMSVVSTGTRVPQQDIGPPFKEFDGDLSSEGQWQGERIPELKRGHGSWYDVMRFAVSKRRRHVLSINNAMVALADLMMEQHRSRVMKNREKMRYHMLLEG